MKDGTCYVVCSGYLPQRLEQIMLPLGGIEFAFAKSASDVRAFALMTELPTVCCLQALPFPNAEMVSSIRALLEKVTALREIGRQHKGLCNGNRFSHVKNTELKIGEPLRKSLHDVAEDFFKGAKRRPQDHNWALKPGYLVVFWLPATDFRQPFAD